MTLQCPNCGKSVADSKYYKHVLGCPNKPKDSAFLVSLDKLPEHLKNMAKTPEHKKFEEEQKERERKTYARASTYWINT